jgi:phenylpropionate dioxygenase-like ring-hydroxylating dioxygenase large terminal subunit
VLTKAPSDPAAVAIEGFREAIALFVCPTSEETCRVWFRLAMTDFASSDASMRAFQDAIFAEDAPIVASQRPKRLPLDPVAELHSAADRSSAAYRRYLKRAGVGYGTC